MISATVSIVSGSLDGGLSTIGLPLAIAGATLWAARLSGKLNGLIAAIGPIGKRRVMPTRSFDDGMRSSGISSPVIRSASSAPSRNVSTARSTSTSASRIGLPASSAMSRPSSSRRALMPGADVAQDPAALVGGQLAGDLERGDRGLDRLLVLLRGRVVGRAGRIGGIGRVGDLEDVRRLDPAAGKEDRMRLGAGDGHAMSSCPAMLGRSAVASSSRSDSIVPAIRQAVCTDGGVGLGRWPHEPARVSVSGCATSGSRP